MEGDSRSIRTVDVPPKTAVTTMPLSLPSSKLDVAMTLWRTLHDNLSPIIGHRGMTALFRRSLYLTHARHPWLAPVCEAAAEQDTDALDRLRSALLLQAEAEADAAHCALLDNFRNLLVTLIGASLTDRLMRPVPDNTSSGPAVQDTSP